jgi:hypothetical protein
MKLALQYLTDQNGATQAVQLPLADWERVINRLNKYEQAFKLKSDLQEALDQVRQLRKSGQPKQTLTAFLDEL